jgi:hypothetical protein
MAVVYKIISFGRPDETEKQLLQLSAEGWRVIACNKKFIILGKKVK